MNAVDSNPSSSGGWESQLKRFHHRGVKTDFFGGVYNPNVISSALKILSGQVEALEFPAKSYIVAICYADYIARHYNDDFDTVLSNPRLLHDDDHFVPLNDESRSIYDALVPLVLTDAFKATELYGIIIGYCREELGEFNTQ